MAKQKIKPDQVWKHKPTQNNYIIISKGHIKIPHVCWFKSVTYTSEINRKLFTRFLEDFENKFEYIS